MRLIEIRETVTACEGCIYRLSDAPAHSGEWREYHLCSKAVKEIPDPSTIPAWCPLPNPPAPVERRCGTCSKWKRMDDHFGRCMADLPAWVSMFKTSCFVGESTGTKCPTWAAKEGK